ncbi:glyoxalase [Ktedonobacter sp. SOSP1-52]|uniref:VOC family protein n=1 Tax=Ktedonobacter sp. SOSP1-52 TaxID=2778366 RepID=UPI00191548EC|nr:VOC family protein [Ktedonobacter sp. SOSP1-52]GHO63724.1 glyoxalase [Ktedonobacter sp. SOSP1-52]
MINKIVATVLFVQDLHACITFYQEVLGLHLRGSDPASAAFLLDDRYLLLLDVSGAADLIGSEPETLKHRGAAQMLLAAEVENVDATYEALKAKGITFLKPPINQPWGLRTAHFADPEGNIWEINQPIQS